MGRFLLFFAIAVVLRNVLTHVPVIGGLFARSGIFGIWITAILLSMGMTWWGERAVRLSRSRSELRSLLQVENPHNHGKAGSYLYSQGRVREALPHLEQAAKGEPNVAEWQFRLGQAQLDSGDSEAALAALRAAVRIDPEHAYGAAQLRLAEVCERLGDPAGALEACQVFERNHGPSPESCYRRGRALAGLKRREEARQAFEEVSQVAQHAARYQRGEAKAWIMKAKIALLRA